MNFTKLKLAAGYVVAYRHNLDEEMDRIEALLEHRLSNTLEKLVTKVWRGLLEGSNSRLVSGALTQFMQGANNDPRARVVVGGLSRVLNLTTPKLAFDGEAGPLSARTGPTSA